MQTPTSRQTKNSGIKTLVMIPELNFVEMGRIELPSDVVLPGLLRAQFATEFLCPNHHANMWLIRAQLPKCVPSSGNIRWIQWLSK